MSSPGCPTCRSKGAYPDHGCSRTSWSRSIAITCGVGRRNWTFAGNDEGARRAAIFFSLIASCKLHHLNPFEYLRDVLVRVLSHPARDVLALTPRDWAKAKQRDAQVVPDVAIPVDATECEVRGDRGWTRPVSSVLMPGNVSDSRRLRGWGWPNAYESSIG